MIVAVWLVRISVAAVTADAVSACSGGGRSVTVSVTVSELAVVPFESVTLQ